MNKEQKPAKALIKDSKKKKNRGTGLFFSTLLLLAFGVAVFYSGWVQFRLDKNEYGVIYTKTHGWETKTLENGEFAWRWQSLLPTNLTLHVFSIEARTIEIKKEGSLPSGNLYASMMGIDTDFDWSTRINVHYRLNAESLPGKVSNGWVQENGLDAIYAEYEASLEATINSLLNKGVVYRDIGEMEKDISNRLKAVDADIEITRITVTEWHYPDVEFYREIKAAAIDLSQKRKTVLGELEESELRKSESLSEKIDFLRRYGEVLTEFPVLVEIITSEGLSAVENLINNAIRNGSE